MVYWGKMLLPRRIVTRTPQLLQRSEKDPRLDRVASMPIHQIPRKVLDEKNSILSNANHIADPLVAGAYHTCRACQPAEEVLVSFSGLYLILCNLQAIASSQYSIFRPRKAMCDKYQIVQPDLTCEYDIGEEVVCKQRRINTPCTSPLALSTVPNLIFDTILTSVSGAIGK
jgi:hypothetical protein